MTEISQEKRQKINEYIQKKEAELVNFAHELEIPVEMVHQVIDDQVKNRSTSKRKYVRTAMNGWNLYNHQTSKRRLTSYSGSTGSTISDSASDTCGSYLKIIHSYLQERM